MSPASAAGVATPAAAAVAVAAAVAAAAADAAAALPLDTAVSSAAPTGNPRILDGPSAEPAAAAAGAVLLAEGPFTAPPAGVGAKCDAAAAGNAGGGEGLPAAGNGTPVDRSSGRWFMAALRAGLGPALCSAAAKSLPRARGSAESAASGAFECAERLLPVTWETLIGSRETVGMALIPEDVASDVPEGFACGQGIAALTHPQG